MGDEVVRDAPGVVQEGIRRVFDEASTYYRDLRWEKTRLTRFEKELTQRALEEELTDDRVAAALELGCGPGTWTGLLAARADEVTAVDLSAQMLEQAKSALAAQAHVRFRHADAARYETDARFDRVLSVRVLEYVPEWAQIVERIGEVAKPGARVVLVTKTKYSIWRGTGRERWFTAKPRRLVARLRGREQRSDFWQRYISVRQMRRALEAAGFEQVRVRPVIFGLPIFVRGTMQYPILPEFAEQPAIDVTRKLWNWVSKQGAAVRMLSLVLSESYAVSAVRR